VVKDLVREYWAHRPMELAAALSYYTILSVTPLVLITVAVAGLIFERAVVEGRIITEMRAQRDRIHCHGAPDSAAADH
jgi:membrane protein